MTELNSFGSVLTFAIELEARLVDVYAAAGKPDWAAASEKRKQKLERVRRENVVEITLEPIEGLNAADYTLPSGASPSQVATIAARFYGDVAPKINVRSAARSLEQTGKQHAEYAAS